MCVVSFILLIINIKYEFGGTGRKQLKVPITPKTFFRFVKSLHGIRKNAEKIFAIG